MSLAEGDVPRRIPSATPYHPKEFGAKNPPQRPTIRSGLLGVLWLVVVAFATIVILIVAFPFLLLGLSEVVIDEMPDRWRVRWVRRPEDDDD